MTYAKLKGFTVWVLDDAHDSVLKSTDPYQLEVVLRSAIVALGVKLEIAKSMVKELEHGGGK